jgi:hypothetical protein
LPSQLIVSPTPPPLGLASNCLSDVLYVFYIPISELSKKLRFLAIAGDYLFYTPPRAGEPLSFEILYVVLHSHQSIIKKAKVSCHRRWLSLLHAPLGQASHCLFHFLYVFYIPISQLLKKLRFLAISVDYLFYTPPRGKRSILSLNSYMFFTFPSVNCQKS